MNNFFITSDNNTKPGSGINNSNETVSYLSSTKITKESSHDTEFQTRIDPRLIRFGKKNISGLDKQEVSHAVNLKKEEHRPVNLVKEIEGDINSLSLRKFNLENMIYMEKLRYESIIPRRNKLLLEQSLGGMYLVYQIGSIVSILTLIIFCGVPILSDLFPSMDYTYFYILLGFLTLAYIVIMDVFKNLGPLPQIRLFIERQKYFTGKTGNYMNFGAKNFSDEKVQSEQYLKSLQEQLNLVNSILDKIIKQGEIHPASLDADLFDYAKATWNESPDTIMIKKKRGAYEIEKNELENEILEVSKELGSLKLQHNRIIDNYKASQKKLSIFVICFTVFVTISTFLLKTLSLSSQTKLGYIALTGIIILLLFIIFYNDFHNSYIRYNIETQTGVFDSYAMDNKIESTEILKTRALRKLDDLQKRHRFLDKVINEIDYTDVPR